MAVNLQHLRAFHAIATDGGVSRAARRLNVSQPTLSQQLKALEARHGLSLFDGRKTPLQLTAAGRELFTLTGRLFGVVREIDALLGDGGAPADAVLRLGADNPFYAASMVERLRHVSPHLGVQVRMGNAREMIHWLTDAQIDAALASDPPIDAAFGYDPLWSDWLVCAMSHRHPMATVEAVPVAALADETLLLREPTSKTRALTERILADAGVRPRATIELQTRETIREGIALELGVSLFFRTECPPDPRLCYRPLATPASRHRLECFLVFQHEQRRSLQVRALRKASASLFEQRRPPLEPQ